MVLKVGKYDIISDATKLPNLDISPAFVQMFYGNIVLFRVTWRVMGIIRKSIFTLRRKKYNGDRKYADGSGFLLQSRAQIGNI